MRGFAFACCLNAPAVKPSDVAAEEAVADKGFGLVAIDAAAAAVRVAVGAGDRQTVQRAAADVVHDDDVPRRSALSK